jgi:hypothetical protein
VVLEFCGWILWDLFIPSTYNPTKKARKNILDFACIGHMGHYKIVLNKGIGL